MTWFSFCSVIFLSSRDRLVKKLEWKKTDAWRYIVEDGIYCEYTIESILKEPLSNNITAHGDEY